MIRHQVFVNFKSTVSQETKAALYADLARLANHIDGVIDFQARENISVEDPLVRNFRDMFWFDFRDTSVRDTYLVDETHQAVGGRIVAEVEGGLDGIFVCDIEL